MPVHRTEVLVLGGGPAGAAAALELAQTGYDTALLERSAAPTWKIGETLPPDARVHLKHLKHLDVFLQVDTCHATVSCRAGGARNLPKSTT